LLCSFVKFDEDGDIDPDESSIIPLIDGGTEGFKGQARVILPRITSCFECSMDTFTPTTAFQICTVAENPRKPEHCIAYVMFAINGQVSGKAAIPIKEGWAKLFGSETKLDKDSPEHMRYICENAIGRAKAYNITPLPDYMLTMGVVKSIIPAIASTNALIAAACCNEAFKMISFSSQSMNCWHQYMGATGVHSLLIQYQKRTACPVCSGKSVHIRLDPRLSSLGDLKALLKNTPYSFGDCSFRTAAATLYMNKPASLRKATEKNLAQKLSDLDVQIGTEIYVTSEKLKNHLIVILDGCP
jgi:NEDD8-activating enzyme E1